MSFELESKVITSLIKHDGNPEIAVLEALIALTPECFVGSESRLLFELIVKQHAANHPIDAFTLFNLLDVSLYDYFAKVSADWPSVHSLAKDVESLKTIRQHKEMKQSLEFLSHKFNSQTIHSVACSGLVEDIIKLASFSEQNSKTCNTSEEMADIFLSSPDTSKKMISSGVTVLDSLNGGGFANGSLITVAGRSGTGKTSFAVKLAQGLAANHTNPHTLFFSLEMSSMDIYRKQLSCILSKDVDIFTSKDKTQAVGMALEMPMTIESKTMASIDYIRTMSRITHLKRPLGVVVVDYLGLVQNTNNKLESHVLRQANISEQLAALAIELDCIVIALSQVNREYANRQDKCPVTSDAADSSGSERSSTVWLGVHRPYADDEVSGTENHFVVKCRKNRFGPLWKAVFDFQDGVFRETDQARAFSYYSGLGAMTMKGMKNYKEYADRKG